MLSPVHLVLLPPHGTTRLGQQAVTAVYMVSRMGIFLNVQGTHESKTLLFTLTPSLATGVCMYNIGLTVGMHYKYVL